MPHVLQYHAQLGVLKDGKYYQVMINRPDWCPDIEVLRESARELGVRTVGEVVERLKLPLAPATPTLEGCGQYWDWGLVIG